MLNFINTVLSVALGICIYQVIKLVVKKIIKK